MKIDCLSKSGVVKTYNVSSRFLSCADGYKDYNQHLTVLNSKEDADLCEKFLKLFTKNIRRVGNNTIYFFDPSVKYQIFIFRLVRFLRNDSFKEIVTDTIKANVIDLTNPFDALLYSCLKNNLNSRTGYSSSMDLISTSVYLNLISIPDKNFVIEKLMSSSYNELFVNYSSSEVAKNSLTYIKVSNSLSRLSNDKEKIESFKENFLPLLVKNRNKILV